MELLDIIFQSVSFLLALLAACILLFVNKEQLHSNRILAIMLLILSLINLNSVFLYNAWFLIFPYLHKLILPLTLLISPVAYLYIRSVLQGELKFRKTDWLLLVPSLLCVMDMFSYYTMPVAAKKLYLIEFYKTPSLQAKFNEGFLPAYVFAFIRVVWSAIFIVFNYKLIRRFKKQAGKQLLSDNEALLRWLTIFNGLLAALLFSALVNAIIAPLKKINLSYLDFALGFFVLMICVQLFIRPKLLYGVFEPSRGHTADAVLPDTENMPAILSLVEPVPGTDINNHGDILQLQLAEKPVSELVITPDDMLRYKKAVEILFEKEQPFLKKNYSLEQLVKETNIPRYILSAFINREYGMGFREFINRYRVDFFKHNLNNPCWKNLTLEAIAADCGFTNRSTFINNFKQITGQTPSVFIKSAGRSGIAGIV